MSTTIRDINHKDLEEFFVIDTEDNDLYLHDEGGNHYSWKEGLDGAEVFTRAELKELLNEPENESIEVSIIKVSDGISMQGYQPEDIEITETN